MNNDISEAPYHPDKLLMKILDELSPYRYFYLHLFSLVFIVAYIFGFSIEGYSGITNFSQSMILASPQVKLVNDVTLIFEIFIFLIMFSKYTFWGLDIRTKHLFKRYERYYQSIHEIKDNRSLVLLVCFLTLIIMICFRYQMFIFTDGGNISSIRKLLNEPNFFVYLYMILGFLMNFFLFICAIFSLELRKHVRNRYFN
ncbi:MULTISPECIES: hypothetical protein [unclassified Acinetobacter]|uniref:hypothetical protein n=1 Tax=unclassified Acinetobacter TaxID=196816 RepID=UPI0007D04916|nr:hypothetical protein [Acinetobacter sp. SFD]OAL85711.1 hypothetical protein AY605_14745 [Acinetobacter sp. SFD]